MSRLFQSQLRALDVLVVEGTDAQAAAAAGVSEDDVRGWRLRDVAFAQELSRRRSELELPRVEEMHRRSLRILDGTLQHGRLKDQLKAAEIVESIRERAAANDDLTPRELAFVSEYVRVSNGAAAARAAGYAAKGASTTASGLLQRETVQRAVRAARRELAATMSFDEQFVINNLGAEAVGAESSSDRITATVHLGRARGMFTDVVVKEKPKLTPEERAQRANVLLEKGRRKATP